MGRILEVDLAGMAHGGEALGRHAGKVIFVPYAIAGERVRIEIVEERAHWARGRLLDVISASPDRVDPPCPYFGPDGCGGCRWQHITYERQAELKQEIVADQLRRLGHIPDPQVADTIVLADPAMTGDAAYLLDYGYRNHAQFSVATGGQLGYRRAASHDVIPVDHCLLLHEQLDALHAALDVAWPVLAEVSLRAGINTGEALVLLETVSDEQPELAIDLPASCVLSTGHQVQPLIGDPWIHEEVAGQRYRISAESFFQVNTVGAEALIALVLAHADPQPEDVLLDACCGVGLFALALADSVAEVIGIEASPSACEDFAHNAGNRMNVALHEGAMADVLPALHHQGQRVSLAIMDPPRAGAGATVIRLLASLGPRRIVYVSCDPATLARDSVYLTQMGYRLAVAQPVDMFPQTHHIETVALWTSA